MHERPDAIIWLVCIEGVCSAFDVMMKLLLNLPNYTEYIPDVITSWRRTTAVSHLFHMIP